MNESKNKKIKIALGILEVDFLKLKSLSYFYNCPPIKMVSSLLEEAIQNKIESLNFKDKEDFSRLLEITYELYYQENMKK